MYSPTEDANIISLDVKQGTILPDDSPVPFKLPALHVMGEKDADRPASGRACAPDDTSNDIFYNAWIGEIWQIKAEQAGFLDVIYPPGILVDTCAEGTYSDTDRTRFRQVVAASSIHFVNLLINKDSDSNYFLAPYDGKGKTI